MCRSLSKEEMKTQNEKKKKTPTVAMNPQQYRLKRGIQKNEG